MTMLRELYQSLILDHGRRPRNFSVLVDAHRIKEGFNPLCGDRLTFYIKLKADVVDEITFQGSGCAISMASASLMTDFLKGKSSEEIKEIFLRFHEMVTESAENKDFSHLGKLEVLKGVLEFPARVKCATLAWHTLMGALENNPQCISTE
ncbi:MAG: SUF system NifU family Fe-S cluster assembly protein [Gammaproteobacteria bacterium]|nr:SUF system NifU family Fe-S cluster assembly protein [Gammaproteobacteria bacterium]